jgi:CRP-like cAMP-binding protein
MENNIEIINFVNHVKSYGIEPTTEEITIFISFIKYKKFKKGEVILEKGQICNEAYYSLKGFARSYDCMGNGTEKTYLIFAEHSFFTDHASFISQKPATEFLEAVEDMEVMYIEYENMVGMYKKYHNIESFGRKISDVNFIFSQKRLRSMMNDDALTRYKKLIKHYGEFSLRIPQNVIASYLGITPQSLSRLKRDLE